MPQTGAQALAAIIDDLSQPETCTCGTTAPNARAMEGHLREAHDMDGTAYRKAKSLCDSAQSCYDCSAGRGDGPPPPVPSEGVMVSTFVFAAAIAAAGLVASRVQARAVAAVAGPSALVRKRQS